MENIRQDLEPEVKLNIQINEEDYNKNKKENETYESYVKRMKYNNYHRWRYHMKKNEITTFVIGEGNKSIFYNYMEAIKKLLIKLSLKYNYRVDDRKEFEEQINKIYNKQIYDELINKLII